MPGTFSKLVTVVTGQTITAAERNNEFDNVINNMTPDGVDDASANLAAMQATADPAGGSLATDLRGELKRIRFQLLKLGSASGNWYDALPFLAGVTPATPGATATDLNARLAQFAKQLLLLNVASGNWYDSLSWLGAITPATAGSTATDLTNRLAQIVSQIKALSGGSNWYDAIGAAALLKSGGTMAGAIAMGTNKITGLGAGTASGDAAGIQQVKILQVITAYNNTPFTTTASSFQNTNLAASITPSRTSSKVLVMVCGDFQMGTAGVSAFMSIDLGGTNIGDSSSGFTSQLIAGSSGTSRTPVAFWFLDTPISTSALTYTVTLKSNGTATASFPSANAPVTVIILMEVNGL